MEFKTALKFFDSSYFPVKERPLSCILLSMAKYIALAAAALPLALAINEDGRLYSSYVSLSIELIGFPSFAGMVSSCKQLAFGAK